jgi:hypothetical protein
MVYSENTKSKALVPSNTEVYWRVVGGYSQRMRDRCNSFYAVNADEEYEHFVSASNLILRMGADVDEYLDALFQGADKYYHPSPADLSKSFAEKRWRLYVFNRKVKNHVEQQKTYLSIYTAQHPDLRLGELMMLEELPFEDWLRFLYLEKPSQSLVESAMSQLTNPVLYKEIVKQGFDLRHLIGEGNTNESV